jgi:hypothetical protein
MKPFRKPLSNSQLKASFPELGALLHSGESFRVPHQQDSSQTREIGPKGFSRKGTKRRSGVNMKTCASGKPFDPGLVPKLYGYHENNGSAAIIVEYLSGLTLEEILLNSDGRRS